MQTRDHLPHTFHIPVMGTAFTIDTPIAVARFGISSVISMCDDELAETMRKYYLEKRNEPYDAIEKFSEDFRARRFTAYLNLVDKIVKEQLETLKQEPFEPHTEITKYFEMLPENGPLKAQYQEMLRLPNGSEKLEKQQALRAQIKAGSIDVNIMTKLDRTNYDKSGELLPEAFSDALSGLRGFAKSTLQSGLVFSAGFNRRLYAYIDQFDDFFPDKTGHVKKTIILKVSDFRSSLTQGKFLAKKGVWIAEHRIESGLNCGGHAFASDGYLLGPILEEFHEKKETLAQELYQLCNDALNKAQKPQFKHQPHTRITVQGGIGTHTEDQFLLDHYQVDGTGWASPFLLVKEVTNLDEKTRKLLADAKEDQFYLSPISPLGVPFNTVKGTESERQKLAKFEQGKPGSPCPKGYLVSNVEFSKKPVCTASVFYQKRKIQEIENSDSSPEEKKQKIFQVIQKACLCEDLAASSLIIHEINNKRPLSTAVCPGPNLANFSQLSTLAEMVGHIYGRVDLVTNKTRSNMFVTELKMYVDYFANEVKKVLPEPTDKQIKYLEEFRQNLQDGMAYYERLIPKMHLETASSRKIISEELQALADRLETLIANHSEVIFGKTTV